MRYQVILDDDLKVVEEKIKSDKFFNAEESQEQLNALFQRFLGANAHLQESIDPIFKSREILKTRQAVHAEQDKRLQADIELLERIRDPRQLTQAFDEFAASLDERKDFLKRVDEYAEMTESSLNEVKDKLAGISEKINAKVIEFHKKMAVLKSGVKNEKRAGTIILFLVTVFVAFVLEVSGLGSFSDLFLLTVQVTCVFILTEFGINKVLKWNARETIRPELLGTLAFLRNEYSIYSAEIDKICNRYGIKREHLFYVIDQVYEELKNEHT